jgi:hypothetical protein
MVDFLKTSTESVSEAGPVPFQPALIKEVTVIGASILALAVVVMVTR